MADPMKPPKAFKEQQLNKSKGILDDYAVRKNVATREGSITRTPVADIDIANKKYVDLKADGIDPDHTHSKLVADDGSPDAIICDSDGLAVFSVGIYTEGSINTFYGSNDWFTINESRPSELDFGFSTTKAGTLDCNIGINTTWTFSVNNSPKMTIDGTSANRFISFSSHVVPSSDENYDLGGSIAPDQYWRTAYIKKVVLNSTAEIDGAVAGELNVNANLFKMSEKCAMTSIGGFAVKLTNRTGSSSTKGHTVKASTAFNNSVGLPSTNELMAIGVFLESGILNGSEAWIVISGIAEVRADASGWAVGDRIVTSATAGRGASNNAPSVAVHFQEIGHAIASAGANLTRRVMLHFN